MQKRLFFKMNNKAMISGFNLVFKKSEQKQYDHKKIKIENVNKLKN